MSDRDLQARAARWRTPADDEFHKTDARQYWRLDLPDRVLKHPECFRHVWARPGIMDLPGAPEICNLCGVQRPAKPDEYYDRKR